MLGGVRAFDLHRPTTVADATSLLETTEHALVLGGGAVLTFLRGARLAAAAVEICLDGAAACGDRHGGDDPTSSDRLGWCLCEVLRPFPIRLAHCGRGSLHAGPGRAGVRRADCGGGRGGPASAGTWG